MRYLKLCLILKLLKCFPATVLIESYLKIIVTYEYVCDFPYFNVVLWSTGWSFLENFSCRLEKNENSTVIKNSTVISNWHCLLLDLSITESGLLMIPYKAINLSISPCSSISFCLLYFAEVWTGDIYFGLLHILGKITFLSLCNYHLW